MRALLALRPNPASSESNAPLELDGGKIALERVMIDGVQLDTGRYDVNELQLVIAEVPQGPFTLEISTICNPRGNSELSGLYISNNVFCTQCEAEGFRRITDLTTGPM